MGINLAAMTYRELIDKLSEIPHDMLDKEVRIETMNELGDYDNRVEISKSSHIFKESWAYKGVEQIDDTEFIIRMIIRPIQVIYTYLENML